jgi:hypothetical protein
MKSSFMRPAFALALALGLTACGGKATFPIGVTVNGLLFPNLVLSTNGMDLAIAPGANGATVTGSFAKPISYGDVYEVIAKQQPDHQTCVPVLVTNKDTAGRLATINATFTCTTNAYTIGGPITGLKAAGLVLTNGSNGGTFAATSTSTTFTLPAVTYNTTYGVTVLTQPTGQVCTVGAKGIGTMGDAMVQDIAVTCVDTAP